MKYNNAIESPLIMHQVKVKPSKFRLNSKSQRCCNGCTTFQPFYQAGKILNWAHEEVEEADELFSNCSSTKRSQKALNDLNEQIRKQRMMKKNPNSKVNHLQTIPESTNSKKNASSNKNIPVPQTVSEFQPRRSSIDKNRSNNNPSRQKKNSSHEQPKPSSREAKKPSSSQNLPSLAAKAQNRSDQFRQNQIRMRNTNSTAGSSKNLNARSREKVLSTVEEQASNHSKKRSSNSREKPSTQVARQSLKSKPQPLPKKQEVPKVRPPPSYLVPQTDYTVATHQQQLEIESFFRNDLANINEEERKLQQELRVLHVQSKNKIKEVEAKHQIRTDYKHSDEVIHGVEAERQGYTQHVQNQDELEESLQRLDNHLIRRELKSRQQTQQDEQSIHSLINPLSNPIELHKQVLQLAENISRFDNVDPHKEPQAGGYAEKCRNMKKMKKPVEQGAPSHYSKGHTPIQTEIVLSESQNVSNCTQQYMHPEVSGISKPPQFQYSRKRENDSLSVEHEAPEKIQVNQKLRKFLLDDD